MTNIGRWDFYPLIKLRLCLDAISDGRRPFFTVRLEATLTRSQACSKSWKTMLASINECHHDPHIDLAKSRLACQWFLSAKIGVPVLKLLIPARDRMVSEQSRSGLHLVENFLFPSWAVCRTLQRPKANQISPLMMSTKGDPKWNVMHGQLFEM